MQCVGARRGSRLSLGELDSGSELTRSRGQLASHVSSTSRATEAIAESYYQRGGIHEAVLQLERLARRDDLDYYQRAGVSARLTELRIQLGELNQDRERERNRERDARRG